ncbi:MAG: apolipoprotein N-acyltransferase [Paracoccaceae bacterium]|nr:apolipoprotein N-acyltransferase [Paracoccaceae bacterium]
MLGAIASLGQAPYEQPIAMLLAFSLAFVMLRVEMRAGGAALTGWALGLGYFGVALFWIVEPFQIDPDQHAWMAPFALFFMSAGLALFWGGAFWVARWLTSGTWPLILSWTAAEVARAYVFTGFPWASPAQALVAGSAGQGLAIVGPHGLMFCLMLTAWCLSLSTIPGIKHGVRSGQALLLFGAIVLIYMPPPLPGSPLTGHWVRLIQPNAAQHLKWQPEFAQAFYDKQLQFTAAPPASDRPPPSLTVWPETAIPWRLETAAPALVQIANAAGGKSVALGLLRQEDDALFNALAVLDATGNASQVYDKHHLVPFGEYIPFGSLLNQFGLTGLAQNSAIGFASGEGPELLDFGVLGRGLPLICYEVVFAHGVNGLSERPAFLLQITNDAWFGQNVGPQQHLAQARMRAIEQGLPLMRAANTGISAMIDPKGRILASLPMDTAGYVDAPLPMASSATVYSRLGDGPIVILLAFGLFGARWTRGRH